MGRSEDNNIFMAHDKPAIVRLEKLGKSFHIILNINIKLFYKIASSHAKKETAFNKP